jgi:uncharacterized membrane protein
MAIDGATNAGEVTFRSIDEHTTDVSLALDYESEGLIKTMGPRSVRSSVGSRVISIASRSSSKPVVTRPAPGAARSMEASAPDKPG